MHRPGLHRLFEKCVPSAAGPCNCSWVSPAARRPEEMRLSAAQTLVTTSSTSGRPLASGLASGCPPAAAPGACRAARRAAAAPRQPAPQPSWQQQAQPHRMRLPPPGVTNEGHEMREPATIKGTALDDDDYLTIDPENPNPNPLLGPLERSVGLTFAEALFVDDVDPEAEAYWFSEPVGGWNKEKVRLRKLKQLDVPEEDVFAHIGAAALKGRMPLGGLREGQLLRGTVTAQLLHHGVRVDVGAAYDGLLPMEEEQWEGLGAKVGAQVAVGCQIEVRVHRLRNPRYYRFPIQLAAVNSALAAKIVAPQDHKAPMDLRIMTLTPEEIAEMSEGQRTWVPKVKQMQLIDDYGYENGWDTVTPPSERIHIPKKHAAARDAAVDRMMQRMLRQQ